MALGSFGGGFAGGFAGAASVQIVIRAIDKFSKEFKSAETHLTKISKVSKLAAVGVAGLFVVAAKKAANFEKEMIKLEVVLKNNQESLREMKQIISEEGGGLFSKQDVAAAIAYAKSVGVADDTIKRLLPRLKDQAAVFGEDLTTAMMAVVRASKFGEAELAERIGLTLRENAVLKESQELYGKRLGQLTQEQKEQVILQAVLNQTNKTRGGEARALETTAGKMKQLQVSAENALVALGEAGLIDALKTAATWLQKIANIFDSLSPEAKKWVTRGVVGAGAGVIGLGAAAKGVDIAKTLGLIKTANMNVQAATVTVIGKGITGGATTTAGRMLKGGGATGAGTAAGGLAALGAGTIGLITAGAAAMVAKEMAGSEVLKRQYGEAAPKLGTAGLPFQTFGSTEMLAILGMILPLQEQKNVLDQEEIIANESLLEQQGAKIQSGLAEGMANQTVSQTVMQLAKDQLGYKLASEELDKQLLKGTIDATEYNDKQKKLNNAIVKAKDEAKAASVNVTEFARAIEILMASLAGKKTREAKGAFLEKAGLETVRQAMRPGERAGGGFSAQSRGRSISRGHTYSGFTSHLSSGAYRTSTGGVSKMATGGIVRSPTLAMIGESGPEAVVPLNGPNAGMGGIQVNIGTVQGLDADNVAEALQEKLQLLINAS